MNMNKEKYEEMKIQKGKKKRETQETQENITGKTMVESNTWKTLKKIQKSRRNKEKQIVNKKGGGEYNINGKKKIK